jgi:hypothetical protein
VRILELYQLLVSQLSVACCCQSALVVVVVVEKQGHVYASDIT